MSAKFTQRRLAAILAADAVGFSRLMGRDEEGALAAFNAHRVELFDPCVTEHTGRIFKFMGDGFLAEFGSVVDALQCALALQAGMVWRNEEVEPDRRIILRIGINVGDVVIQDDDVFGDGVNIASRLEGFARPGGICMSEDAYRQARGKIDAAYEDLGLQRLKNIVEPVKIYSVAQSETREGQPSATGNAPGMLERPEKPSLLVLPFVLMGSAADWNELADGLTEDLITTLSKISGLLVIARSTSFALADRHDHPAEVAGELGVRHVLSGSVRAAGERVRVSVHLKDGLTGEQLWAERFDRRIEDVFAIQDEITLNVATEMQVQFSEGEQARLRYTTTTNLDAWKYWIRGLGHFRRDVSKAGVGRARDCWEQALALDPKSASLNAMMGLMHWASARYGWWDDRETSLRRSDDYVEAALSLDPQNADAHCARALTLLIRGQHEAAVQSAESAIDLAPGSADIAAFSSLVFNFSGYPDRAKLQIERAMRLSPIYPAWYLGDLGFAQRLLGHYDDAIRAFREYGERHGPGFGQADLTIIYDALTRPDDALEQARQLLAARPDFSIASWRQTQHYSDPARLAADIAALRKARLPE